MPTKHNKASPQQLCATNTQHFARVVVGEATTRPLWHTTRTEKRPPGLLLD